jgi:hypothetical protein
MKVWRRVLTVALVAAWSTLSFAASHREAPLIALDPTADITDTYAFRSWEDPSKVVFIMNVIPGQEPGSGPNYFSFDDQVTYRIHLDVDQDGKADDIIYQFNFKTQKQPAFANLPVPYVGVDGVTGLPPGIRALDGPQAAGLGMRQIYAVTEIRGNTTRTLGAGLKVAVPSNIGPRTIPDYENLADQGIFNLRNGGRVFIGQRDETFYIDLGATFDTLNFRSTPILSDSQDAMDDANPFGNDTFSGFNVSTIAIEVPIADITNNPKAVIGMYASTSRQRLKILKHDGTSRTIGNWLPVARLANPLVNELLIGLSQKDRWNATNPENEKQFLDFYLNPRLAAVINLAFGTSFPTTGRTDLVQALLKYPGQNPNVCKQSDRCAELLRLDLAVTPTPPA